MSEQPVSPEVTSDDKLWSALGYPIPILPIIVLFLEDKKNRPFIKFHAVQSLAFNVVLWILYLIISTVTLGVGAICAPVIFLVTLWPAFDAYSGKYTNIPFITDFIKKQGWTNV